MLMLYGLQSSITTEEERQIQQGLHNIFMSTTEKFVSGVSGVYVDH